MGGLPCAQALIEKVTENNESPAPGWALDQMARLTIQKPGIEIEMAELLFKRLNKNGCDVKLKTLRAMHFISRRGSVAFRRACQRGSQQIRVHLSTPPPAHTTHVCICSIWPRARLEAGKGAPTARVGGSLAGQRDDVGSVLTFVGVCVQRSKATRTRCTAMLRGASSATRPRKS